MALIVLAQESRLLLGDSFSFDVDSDSGAGEISDGDTDFGEGSNIGREDIGSGILLGAGADDIKNADTLLKGNIDFVPPHRETPP